MGLTVARKMAAPMRWRHQFEVEGATDFPIDMLRFDECWPANGADAATLQSAVWRGVDGGYFAGSVFRVRLYHDDVSKGWKPTLDRWTTYGWRVVT